MTGVFHAVASVALATALFSGIANAQTAEPDPGETKAKAAEQKADDSTGTTTADSTKATESDATEATSTVTKPKPVKPVKRTSKPFVPTEKIEAESVISFPANI